MNLKRCLLTILLFSASHYAAGGERATPSQRELAKQLAQEFDAVATLVKDRHLNPPTYQEMLLRGLQAMYRASSKPFPVGLTRQVSRLGLTQSQSMLESAVASADEKNTPSRLRAAFRRGVLAAIGGGGSLQSADKVRVARQLRANMYVGIGIALSQRNGRPMIAKVFPRGPAYGAKAKVGDVILKVDGVSTDGKSLQQVVQMLRGQQGQPVEADVRQEGEPIRQLKMVRNVVPIDTVTGVRRQADQNWDYRLTNAPEVAYVKILEIKGSTITELRTAARRLRRIPLRGVVLDLSESVSTDPRHVAMLADSLMGKGLIGYEQTSTGKREYRSSEDHFFRELPLVVLISRRTVGGAEWLAAALRDSGRARLIGTPTFGGGLTQREFDLPDQNLVITLVCGRLLRANGQSLDARSKKRSQTVGPLRLAAPVKGAAVKSSAVQAVPVPKELEKQDMEATGGAGVVRPHESARPQQALAAALKWLKSRSPQH